ncbi:hypothetical protein BVRB_7g178210 [Beta vulgaris subsp. vulgaris]|nr:hypothetical protein BVRB_7g178210 [Beta vulgaris subsp. vulgaris]
MDESRSSVGISMVDDLSVNMLKWVRENFMIYNYCTDTKRFLQGLPKECRLRE